MKTQFLYKKSVLKISACVLGYALWVMLSSSHSITLWLPVPLYFYNLSEEYTINAPPTLNIQVLGPRSIIQHFSTSTTALHINARDLHEGINKISVSSTFLSLPSGVHMLQAQPNVVEVHLDKKENASRHIS